MFPRRPELYFEDERRLIDIVMVHSLDSEQSMSERQGDPLIEIKLPGKKRRPGATSRRTIFEHNLELQGLQLESFINTVFCHPHHCAIFTSAPVIIAAMKCEFHLLQDRGLRFVKVHAPWHVLANYAQILQIRMPLNKVA